MRSSLGAIALAVLLVGCVGVHPIVGVPAGELVTSAPEGAHTPGVEGSVLVVQLVDSAGRTMVHRPFAFPSDRQPIPAGDYVVRASWRDCVGSCASLGAPQPFCELPVTVRAGQQVTVLISPSELLPGSTCR